MMPKVSVIIPNYNHEKYLEQRFSTVLDQSFTDFEIIFLDDASTDNSRAVYEQFTGDPSVRTIVNTENSGGPFKQWNKGIDQAKGEYIWIAESDDFADPRFLETLVRGMDLNPNAGLAYCQSWVVEEEGHKKRKADWYEPFTDKPRWDKPYTNAGKDELRHYLSFKNTIPNASAVIFRRSVIGTDIRPIVDGGLCGDWKFWVDILLKSDIVYFPVPMNYFRVAHSASQRSKTGQQGLTVFEGLDVFSYIREKIDIDNDLKERIFRHQLWTWASLSTSSRFTRNTDRLIFQKFKLIWSNEMSESTKLVNLLGRYYHILIPVKKNFFYKHTVGRLRHWYFSRF